MYKIDVDKGQAIEEIPTNAEYTMMKLSRYICAATSTGSVDLFDPATLQIVKTWQAHTSKINSMDAKTDYLVTCGWSHRQYGPPLLDHLAKVYDLRRLEQLAPISFPSGAAYVQIHPKMSTTSLLASQLGHLQIVDLVSSENVAILHAHLPNVMTLMIIAPSGNVWAIVDQDNGIHLWGSPEKLQFAEGFKPTEFADNVRQVPRISVDEDVPFNTIGMPYYREKLLSAWGNDRVFEVGNPPAALDIGILKHLRPNPAGAGHIAPNPRKILRNQVSAVKSMDPNGIASTGPKLLSERARDSKVTSNGRRESDGAEAMLNMKLADNTKADVPSHYAHLGIKGSSFGIEDFDFRYKEIGPRMFTLTKSMIGTTTRHAIPVLQIISPILT